MTTTVLRMIVPVGVVLAMTSIHTAGESVQEDGNPIVVMETSLGSITVELLQDEAPVSVENFVTYVNNGFYDGTVFHRVIKGFMVQGGGMTEDLTPKPTQPPIQNEARNGLKNERGTLAMARTSVIDSATSQFFINTVDNQALDHRDTSAQGYGYAVFGRVIDGMDVVDTIEGVATHSVGGMQDVPREAVVILSAAVQ